MMRGVVMAALLLVGICGGAGAGPVPETVAPEPVYPQRPMAETPDWRQAYPSREAYEEAMREILAEWRSRIMQYRIVADRHGGDAVEDAAQRLVEDWRLTKQQWQKVRQTKDENFETARTHFLAAFDDLARTWNAAQAQLAAAD